MYKFKLAILGGGNMASAIINGILKGGVLSPKDIIVSDNSVEKRAELNNFGLTTTDDNTLLFSSAKFLMFAVKPQVAGVILAELKASLKATNIITIMAGISKAKIKAMLGDVAVTRIMPNTPAMVMEGMSAIDASEFNANDKKFVFDIFNTLGKTVALEEKYFDAVTSVSGSGPAYVYMFINAMIKGGIEGGLTEADSKLLTLQTFKGAVKMVETSALPIETLVDNVCSKDGTTIQAVDSFRTNNLEEIIKTGIKKCKNRSEELSKL